MHEIRHRVNGLKYPLFNRNTRIKKQLPDDKIEILDAPEIPKKPENNIVMNLMPSITMLGLVVVFRGIMNTSGSSGSYVILSVCSMALGIVTTILGFISGNKKYKQDCEERITKYNSYIDKKKEEIEIKRREEALTSRALEGLKEIQHVHVLGSEKAEEHCGILTFTIDGVHPHDVSAILDADRCFCRKHEDSKKENGLWRVEIFTMKY